MTFDQHCQAGERADALLASGDLDAAEAAYRELLADIEACGTVDSFIMAKLTLGLLLAKIQRGEIAEAHAIWISQLDDGLFGLGIYALEHGHTSVHDLMCYFTVSAFLHSLSLEGRAAAASAVNDFMTRALRYATSDDPSLIPLALSNWRIHLDEIFDDAPTARHLRAWAKAAKRVGGVVCAEQVQFPRPSPWRITWCSGVAATFYPDGRVET